MKSPLPSSVRAGLLIVACQALVLLHVAVVPAWEAPDEPWHLAYAEALAVGRPPDPADTYEYHHPPGGYLWPALALRALAWRNLPRAAYEPRFPLAANAYLHPSGDPGAAMLRLLRVWNGLLLAPALALAWAAARRLGRHRVGRDWGGRDRVGRDRFPGNLGAGDRPGRDRSSGDLRRMESAVATVFCALIPMAPFTLATLTNDSAAFLIGSLLWYVAARRIAGSTAGAGRRAEGAQALLRGTALGLTAGLAAVVKLNVLPLVLVPVLAVGGAVFGRQAGTVRRRAAWFAVGELVIAAAIPLALLTALSRIPLLTGLERLPDQLWHRSAGGGLLRSGLATDLQRLLDSTAGVYGWMNVVLDARLRRLILILFTACLGVGLLPARWMAWGKVRRTTIAKVAAGAAGAGPAVDGAIAASGAGIAVDRANATRQGDSGVSRLLALAAALLLVLATLGNAAMDPAALQGRLLLPAWPALAWLAGRGLVRLPRLLAITVPLLLLAAQLLATGVLLPVAYGGPVNGAPLLQRGTEQAVEPSLRLLTGQTIVEQLTVTAPLVLQRLELGVLVGRGPGRLRLSLWRESGSGEPPALLAQQTVPLETLGRRAIDGGTRIGPLADTSWLGVDLAPSEELAPGARLRASVEMIPGSVPATAGEEIAEGAGTDEALLWTAQPSAAQWLRREPIGSDAPAIAWIAYGQQKTEAPR